MTELATVVIVVADDEDARQLVAVLQREAQSRGLDGSSFADSAVVSIAGLDLDPETFALEVEEQGCFAWLVLPAGEEFHAFARQMEETLERIEYEPLPAFAFLPEGWGISELLEAVGDRPGALSKALTILWLASGPRPGALRQYLVEMAEVPHSSSLSTAEAERKLGVDVSPDEEAALDKIDEAGGRSGINWDQALAPPEAGDICALFTPNPFTSDAAGSEVDGAAYSEALRGLFPDN